ncbi:putative GNAT family acetyltransferase [Exophiala viscosa]|uniref:GNAT family acetyltransferase n=1 Tax=Exophiala viscosa TaxID=2486360 RepID=A0AAN6DMM6_9EURO|nr:putative GNAT family acetyltransferase [Exophiala viscosa]KAI1620973.1 putative GNAT family acetyltransferase [Exophiala viscosa]
MDFEMPTRTWTRDNYLISTDPSIIPLDALNDIFASDDFHWGLPLPIEHLRTLVHKSICFALYEVTNVSAGDEHSNESQQRRKLIGFARWITDMVTVNYLTDVYILPEYRSKHLGAWMMECIDEVFTAMPHVRGMILIADRGSPTEALYRKYLAMVDLESPGFLMDRKGRGAVSQ